jgi:4-hydroxybenzoate polyprenyltransferase
MRFIPAFLQLVRWPNLVFIIISQCLFYYCIVQPVLPADYFELDMALQPYLLWWLVLASVLIAASGYIINDYFDRNIDLVNKPNKIVIDRFIKRRSAIILHFVLNALALAISFYISWHTNFLIFIANCICVALLWLYSTTFKKKLLTGNIIISFLTAWTILVVYCGINPLGVFLLKNNDAFISAIHLLYKFTVLYAGFAFVISLVREVIKDVEDMDGDKRYGCTTLPLVWGINAAKMFTAVWLIVLIAAVIGVLVYVIHFLWWGAVLYSLILLVPLLFIVKQLLKAFSKSDFTALSSMIKLVMLLGILSMAVIFFYL